MSELSQRLRDGAAQLQGGEESPHAGVMREAATEVERLAEAFSAAADAATQATVQIAGLLVELDTARQAATVDPVTTVPAGLPPEVA